MESIRVRPDPEKQRQYHLRANNLVPLNVMWTLDVPYDIAQAALAGVIDVVNISGQKREVNVLGSRRWSTGAYSSANWYLNEAKRRQRVVRDYGYGPQLDVENLANQFYEEPWQNNPHWEVMIVNTDLYEGDNAFVFGMTRPDFAYSVQSVKRLIDGIPAGELRNNMVKRLLRHEVGHMFGLPDRNFKVEQKLGLHCTNVCTMRQGMSLDEWRLETIEETENNILFCDDCMKDLQRHRGYYNPLP